MADLPMSKSQERACRLLNIPHGGSYANAAKALETAGAWGDGLPDGETWRSAAKLSDDELVAKLLGTRDAMDRAAAVGSLRAQYGE